MSSAQSVLLTEDYDVLRQLFTTHLNPNGRGQPNEVASLSDATEVLSATKAAGYSNTSSQLLHARKMTALGELASGITHDFRNILQTVISTLELLETRSNDPAEVRRVAASALRASERGIGLTNRLLAFSRCEPVQVEPADLYLSLESATETLARAVGVRMKVYCEPTPAGLWRAVIDPTELELALINLGINARDAMPDGGNIRLGARNVTIPHVDRRVVQRHVETEQRGPRLPLSGGEYIAVTVADTGTGMDATTLARAIEPFFTTKPVGKGTGLGLAMAHTLVSEKQGALRLISALGQGTTVELWLPRAPNIP
jgi:signal transduction histidine kinase